MLQLNYASTTRWCPRLVSLGKYLQKLSLVIALITPIVFQLLTELLKPFEAILSYPVPTLPVSSCLVLSIEISLERAPQPEQPNQK